MLRQVVSSSSRNRGGLTIAMRTIHQSAKHSAKAQQGGSSSKAPSGAGKGGGGSGSGKGGGTGQGKGPGDTTGGSPSTTKNPSGGGRPTSKPTPSKKK